MVTPEPHWSTSGAYITVQFWIKSSILLSTLHISRASCLNSHFYSFALVQLLKVERAHFYGARLLILAAWLTRTRCSMLASSQPHQYFTSPHCNLMNKLSDKAVKHEQIKVVLYLNWLYLADVHWNFQTIPAPYIIKHLHIMLDAIFCHWHKYFLTAKYF